MTETGFTVLPAQLPRLAALYGPGLERLDEGDDWLPGRVTTFSGGAGLVSTLGDYLRFCECLRRGGELDGVRLLCEETVAELCRNQLDGDLAANGLPTTIETVADGVGFGLGVSVVIDPGRSPWRCVEGEVAWGGYASTAFWVDRANALSVVFMTQLLPSSANGIRGELRELVYDGLRS